MILMSVILNEVTWGISVNRGKRRGEVLGVFQYYMVEKMKRTAKLTITKCPAGVGESVENV